MKTRDGFAGLRVAGGIISGAHIETSNAVVDGCVVLVMTVKQADTTPTHRACRTVLQTHFEFKRSGWHLSPDLTLGHSVGTIFISPCLEDCSGVLNHAGVQTRTFL